MSNNLACYPLMRKGRNVDIIIAFDSSADIQTANWIGYAEGYAKQRKIQGWPISIGWPKDDESETTGQELEDAQARSVGEAKQKLKKAQSKDKEEGTTQANEEQREAEKEKKGVLGPCTVWVGSMETRDSDEEPPPSKAVEEEWDLMRPDSGIVVAYLPLITNEKVPDVDPEVSPYLSTWNFEWTPEQIDGTVALAKANFSEGEDRLKRTVRAVYERKKKQRLEREDEEQQLREAEDELAHDEHRRKYSHSDHFS